MKRGALIVIEGVDRTGKSTQAKILGKYLERKPLELCIKIEGINVPTVNLNSHTYENIGLKTKTVSKPMLTVFFFTKISVMKNNDPSLVLHRLKPVGKSIIILFIHI